MSLNQEVRTAIEQEIQILQNQITISETQYISLIQQIEQLQIQKNELKENANEIYREIYPIQEKIKNLQKLLN